jgi:hypothetical protein
MLRTDETESQAVHFDITRCVVIDAEVYPGRAVVGFGYSRGGDLVVKQVEGRRELAALLRRFHAQGRTLVGYNSARYDLDVLRAILAGADAYAVSKALIAGDRDAAREMLRRAGAPRIINDNVDIAGRLQRGKFPPSLKVLAAAMGRRTLEELPFDPDKSLTDEEWQRVGAYNVVDLRHTKELLERVAPDLESLAALSAVAGRDLRSVPAPQVVEAIFKADYVARHGHETPRPTVPDQVIYTPPPGVVRPRNPEAAAWYDRVVGAAIPPVGVGGLPRFRVERARFKVGSLEMSAGSGGLHSIDAPMVYYADEAHEIIAVDVASFYPKIMATKGVVPAAYGETGLALYRGILEERLRLKAAARDATNPAERRKLEVRANGLKLVLNSTFGQFGNPYSTLYDPAALIGVTVTGQLLLLDLVERLQAVGIEVLSANTDGLFVRVARDAVDLGPIVREWERDTGMTLEVEGLARLAIAATNNVATLGLDGKVKRRGDAFKAELAPCSSPSTFALPNALVVGEAVTDALLRDVPPERTVRRCGDLLKFARIARRTGAVASAVLRDDATGAEAELPRVARFYLAKGSRKRIVHHLEGGRHTTPPQATGVELAMDLSSGTMPADVDHSRYIKEARKLIQKMEGYRHRDPDRLEDHPLALEVLDAGLCPCPKWGGKAVLPGADPKRPTYLWDWSRVETVGTYTGPAVGILVVDIDDPAPWSKGVSKGNLPLLGDRFATLADCLVSCHGDATAEGVRAGTARGKLIFRARGLGPDHLIVRMGVSRWHKRYGVDVFYGRGMPSVLGRYSDDDAYRLEGTLSDAPGWVIEMLTPPPSKPRRKPPAVALADGPGDLEMLRAELAAMEPKLDASAWLEKDLGERVILTAPCPFEHESGRNGSADLSAGFHDGEPYIHCMHGTCQGSRRVNDRLRGRVSPGPTRITRPKIGDLIQWTSRGVDQFPEPKRVRDLSPCGGFVFVDGSTTGIPIGEVAVIVPSRSAMPDPSSFTLITTPAAKVHPMPVEFLVPVVIPRGKLVMLVGLGGMGKGMFWTALAADLTTGRAALGLIYTPSGPVDVLVIGCEEGFADTINPRLLAAGADLNRVHRVDGVRDAKGKLLPFSLAHLDPLDAFLASHPEISLVIIDPITGYVGRAGVKDHHDADVRSLLEPLAEIADRRGTTIMASKHLNKNEAQTVLSRVGGSVAYVNVPRACFVVAADPDHEGRRVLAPFKWNLNTPMPRPLAWTKEQPPDDVIRGILAGCTHLDADGKAKLAAQLHRLAWIGEVDADADSLLKAAARIERKNTQGEIDRAIEWLAKRLADGPVGSIIVAKEGDAVLGRRWPEADVPAEKRRPIVLGRVKWWREQVLKPKLGGESKRAGYNGPYLFKLTAHTWPPSADVAIEARKVADTEMGDTVVPLSRRFVMRVTGTSPVEAEQSPRGSQNPYMDNTASTASTNGGSNLPVEAVKPPVEAVNPPVEAVEAVVADIRVAASTADASTADASTEGPRRYEDIHGRGGDDEHAFWRWHHDSLEYLNRRKDF